ncbi:hypothetical protein JJD91_004872 [Salmonella enterica]|nr:hypothetical protein [Salmonella enterica]EHK3516243.1 hypothetical protein [Salmonella enterica]
MTTSQIITTKKWVQITDGNNTATIQFSGEILICSSPTEPVLNNPALRMSDIRLLTVTPPDICWVRAADTDVALTIL